MATLVDGVERGRPDLILSQLEPNSREGVIEALTSTSKRAAEAGLTNGVGQELDAFEISATGIETRVTQLTPYLARAELVSGQLTMRLKDPDKLASTVKPRLSTGFDSISADLSQLRIDEQFVAIYLTQADGRWYVSPGFTGVALAQANSYRPFERFPATLPQSTTAESPEAAVTAFLTELGAGQVQSAADRLVPLEQAAFIAADPLSEEYGGLEEWLGGAVGAEVERLDIVERELDGDRVAVELQRERYGIYDGGGRYTVTIPDDCGRTDYGFGWGDNVLCTAHQGRSLMAVRQGAGWAVSLEGSAGLIARAQAMALPIADLLMEAGAEEMIAPAAQLEPGQSAEVEISGTEVVAVRVVVTQPASVLRVEANGTQLWPSGRLSDAEGLVSSDLSLDDSGALNDPPAGTYVYVISNPELLRPGTLTISASTG